MDGWKTADAAQTYRCLLHVEGHEVRDAQNENIVRHGVSVEKARAVLTERGKLGITDLVKLRVRYFSDSVVLGSKAFVDGIFEAQRDQFSPRRKTGAKRIRESEEPLYTLRQLRVHAVG